MSISNKLLLHTGIILLTMFQVNYSCFAQIHAIQGCNPDSSWWRLQADNEITWDVDNCKRLPHEDNIEMSGRNVSAIITYKVNEKKQLEVSREIIFPGFRTRLKKGEPEWQNYRAYLKRTYTDSVFPPVYIDGKPVTARTSVSKILINGTLHFYEKLSEGIRSEKVLFPSPDKALFIEYRKLSNVGEKTVQINLAPFQKTENEQGFYDNFTIYATSSGRAIFLKKGESCTIPVYIWVQKAGEPIMSLSQDSELQARADFLNTIENNLVLDTPDSILNAAFAFAKIRTSESIFDTKAGVVHSPGGGRYYAGVWANDQVEYAGPFFPFLGYPVANTASLNAYRIFANDMKPDYSRIWSSHEMNTELPCCSQDRGDAAMFAYGASRFVLGTGDSTIALQLWPAIEWSLEYCHRKMTPEGVIASQTDEMEGRIATGSANLSTSSLTYGALLSASHLAISLGKQKQAEIYTQRADSLYRAIESYFGADIDGFHTYRYFKGHAKLRHWICLPLTMGIMDRKEGTIAALFGRLWSDNGLNVETGENMFWDRGTLYALKGVFMAGSTSEALTKLKSYTCKRFLGSHVPYPVEAWPEGNQAHLAAESALYCRIFTEGLFGIEPTGLHSFSCTPQFPEEWSHMALHKIHLGGSSFDLKIERNSPKTLKISVVKEGKTVYSKTGKNGEKFEIAIP